MLTETDWLLVIYSSCQGVAAEIGRASPSETVPFYPVWVFSLVPSRFRDVAAAAAHCRSRGRVREGLVESSKIMAMMTMRRS